MNPKLKMLCEFYDRSDENVNVDALFKACFFENLEEVLQCFSSRQIFKFIYLCVKSKINLSLYEKYLIKIIDDSFSLFDKSLNEQYISIPEIIRLINYLSLNKKRNLGSGRVDYYLEDLLNLVYIILDGRKRNSYFEESIEYYFAYFVIKNYLSYKTIGILIDILKEGDK